MKLSDLPRRTVATVASVDDQAANDPIARRLRELGFVPGEQVEVMAVGPVAAEPLLVQVGFTRFALRRREAARVTVRVGAAEPSAPAAVRTAGAHDGALSRSEPAEAADVAAAMGHPERPDTGAVPTTPASSDPQARASA